MTDTTTDPELEVLTQLRENESAKQRDIARAIGLSLGMTNSILKRLVTKGFVTMRRINARNIHYLVTPEGIDLIARRSYRYLRRTVGHVVRYKERLLEMLHEAAAPPPEGRGVKTVMLVGESDLDFVVEWCAEKTGLAFEHVVNVPAQDPPKTLIVMSERSEILHEDSPSGRILLGESLLTATRGEM